MKISTIYTKTKGFTLIELLVVIAILATLAGVGYPLIMSQMESAKVSQAQDACAKLVSGVNSFMDDNNGNLPFQVQQRRGKHSRGEGLEDLGNETYYIETAGGKDGGLICVLTDSEESGSGRLNSKRSAYIATNIAEDKGDAGIYTDPTTGAQEMYDPWGEPYRIIVSPNGCYDPYTGVYMRSMKCIAFSLGPDKAGAPDLTEYSRFLKAKERDHKTTLKQPVIGVDDDDPREDNIYTWKKNK